MRLLLAVVLVALVALPVAAQESVEPPAAPDEPTDETPAAAADLAEPDVGDAGDESAGQLVGLDAGEQLDAEQLDGGAPAAVLITLPGGQQAELRLTASLGELALLAVAFFAVTWRVATWAWWILSELI